MFFLLLLTSYINLTFFIKLFGEFFKLDSDILFDGNSYSNIIEAYDEKIEGKLDARISDDFGPKYWKPQIPEEIINDNNILILVHTRYWDKAPIERFKEDFCRLIEGIKNK